MDNIIFRRLKRDEICPAIFSGFDRYQSGGSVYKGAGHLEIYQQNYVKNWSFADLERVCKKLTNIIDIGGYVTGAFLPQFPSPLLVGFCAVDTNLMGEKREYTQLCSLHVSRPFRGKGIGGRLFDLSCCGSKEKGGKKLYISCFYATQTVDFYLSHGCTPASEVFSEIINDKPQDIQLEKGL